MTQAEKVKKVVLILNSRVPDLTVKNLINIAYAIVMALEGE